MNQALLILKRIYTNLLSFFFNDALIVNNNNYTVSFGWVVVSIILLGIIIKNILAIPQAYNGNLYYGENLTKRRNRYLQSHPRFRKGG